MMWTDTIAAIATPPGRGGIGIVRVSGGDLSPLLDALFDKPPVSGRVNYRRFLDADGAVIDEGVALLFEAPASYTGEQVLELQAHGAPVVLDMLVKRLLSLGARGARPGEFTQRAFLNDKLDLAQAEAVADLIAAETQAAARSAQRSLRGAFSSRIDALAERLATARMWTEAAIDFPVEEIDFLEDETLSASLVTLAAEIERTLAEARAGAVLRDGLTVVISGPPNVGKSSLLNRLARHDAAIVTEVPGTTRDLLHERIEIEGLVLTVIDTAGLRCSEDPVERIGIERARQAAAGADVLLAMSDDRATGPTAIDPPPASHTRIVEVRNKVDLSNGRVGLRSTDVRHPVVGLSATTGAGIPSLETVLLGLAGVDQTAETAFLARRRHLDALRRTGAGVSAAIGRLDEAAGGELVAEELRQAERALEEITGASVADDLLGRIFAEFCIGK